MHAALYGIGWCLMVFLVLSRSWATTLVPMTDDELIERSSLIVIGQCTAARSAWMDRRLVTLATIVISEVLKGEPRTQITVVIPGGIDAQRKIPVAAVVAGAPRLLPPEEVVLFLSRSQEAHDRYAITGLAHGKFTVVGDASGHKMVSRDVSPLPQDTAFSTAAPHRPAGAVSLARFREQILHRVRNSRP